MDGKLKLGSRLPNHKEIRASSEGSPLTMQRAFDLLLKDGFVVIRGRGGTVSDAPPHLHQYALVYPGVSRGLSSYLELLAKCVTDAAGVRNSVKIYEHVIPHAKCHV